MGIERDDWISFRAKPAEAILYQLAASRMPGVSSRSEWIRRVLNREAMKALEDLDLETADSLDPAQRDLLEDREPVGA